MASNYFANAEMQQIFRCSRVELGNLKRAYKQQMEQTFVEGAPIIYQLFRIVDADGSLREGMWDAVADSSSVLDSMLSGSRWGTSKPKTFENSLTRAKDEICRSLNREARRKSKAKDSKTVISSRVSNISGMISASGTPIVHANTARRASERLKKKAKGRPYPVRLFPKTTTAHPVERLAMTTYDAYESDSIRYEIPEGENIVVARPESKIQIADVLEHSPSMTPDIMNWIRGVSGSSKSWGSSGNGSRRSENHSLPDPFECSPEPTSPTCDERPGYGRLQDKNLSSGKSRAGDGASNPRLTLSAQIQEAVDRRISSLEVRLMRNVEAMLASRDAEIERLKAGNEEDRAWRDL